MDTIGFFNYFSPYGNVSSDHLHAKVGDTLTVTAEDENGEDVDLTDAKIQWFAGNEEIDGADDDTLVVGDELIGLQIFVEVTDAEGKVYESEATAPVYAALALLSADQTGKSVVTLTTNGPVTALDDIDVFKGTKEVEIDSIDYEDDGAVVTLKNAIVADAEYTVTLTPADEDDEATSATFTGEKAKLDRIEFLNDVLVMKDNTYKEGYAYVKGYDQFDDPVTLSGLTVTPGVGQFKSYDNTTGKITIVDNNNNANATGAFLLIKEVPVFVQYQTGNDVISAQETLKVSSQAYVNELTFGEVEKDGTKRADERLTIDELGSGKYYVEILDVKDQYGDTLDADDLNDQKDGKNNRNKTLFVIPGDSGAFYQTGDFAELNGKTILWLEPVANGAGKPGTMTLTITGAGGKTFSKDITVEDNPYIKTLSVSYPELYAGSAKSAALEFSAIDQYEDAVDLWDFKPEVVNGGKELRFTDFNSMTQLRTKITISGNAVFNTVVKDAGKKTFTVTLNTLEGEAKAKDLITFTEQTAGMQIATKSIAVGEMGTAAKIRSALKSGANLQMDNVAAYYAKYGKDQGGSNTSVNFNKYIQFEDANGNEMVRGTSEKYPFYIEIEGKNVEETLPQPTNALWTTGYFVWSLTKDQIKDTNTASDTPTKVTVGDYDDGTVESADFGAATSLDVYATVYMTNGTTYYKLDEKKFHLTSVQGKDKSYTAKAKNTIYCNSDDPKNTEIAVTAKTDSGETYTVDPSRVQVVPKAPFAVTADNKYTVLGNDATGSGTTTATVYVDNDEETTVDITYTDAAPVATSVVRKFDIDENLVGSDGAEVSRVGAKFDGSFTADSFRLGDAAELAIADGVLTIKKANYLVQDTLKFGIADQYGRNMSSTVFYVDGVKVTEAKRVDTSNKDVTIEWANGTLTGKVILEKGGASKLMTFKQVKTESVKTESGLIAALGGSADVITVDKNIDLSKKLEIPADKTVKLASGVTVDDKTWGLEIKMAGDLKGKLEVPSGASLITKGAVVNNGEMVINGNWEHTGDNTAATKITNNGTVTGKGHVVVDGANIDQNEKGEFKVEGNTLAILGNVTITGGKLGGHVEIASGAKLTLDASTLANTLTVSGTIDVASTGSLVIGTGASFITLDNGLKIDASKGGAITTQSPGVTIEKGESVTLITNDGNTVKLTAGASDNVTDAKISSTTASGTGATPSNQTVTYKITYSYTGSRTPLTAPAEYKDTTGSASAATIASEVVTLVNAKIATLDKATGFENVDVDDVTVDVDKKAITVVLTDYTEPVAKVTSASVSGTKGTELTGTNTIKITLTNDEFLDIEAGTVSWITNLPAGLTATVPAVSKGAATATITVTGTPTEASSDVIAVTIPADVLAKGKAVKAENTTEFDIKKSAADKEKEAINALSDSQKTIIAESGNKNELTYSIPSSWSSNGIVLGSKATYTAPAGYTATSTTITNEAGAIRANYEISVTITTDAGNTIDIAVVAPAAKATSVDTSNVTATSAGVEVKILDQYGETYTGTAASYVLDSATTTKTDATVEASGAPGITLANGVFTITDKGTVADGTYKIYVYPSAAGATVTAAGAGTTSPDKPIGTITVETTT